jgi:hypothetical protein
VNHVAIPLTATSPSAGFPKTYPLTMPDVLAAVDARDRHVPDAAAAGILGSVKPRIMYVELKNENDNGPAWIGRVSFSKTGRTAYYRGRVLRRQRGIFANHIDVETREWFWLSGVKRNGEDRHWAGSGPVVVDDDVRHEYEQMLGPRRRNSPESR